MNQQRGFLHRLNPNLLPTLASVLIILELVLGIFLYNVAGSDVLRLVGMACLAFALVFGFVPIYTLRSQGAVREGGGFLETTAFVDTGVYSFVRHPQHLAGIFANLALVLLVQHWLVLFLGVVSIVALYLNTLKADQYCVEKFGACYVEYIETVPRLNPLPGLWRLLRRR